MADAPKIVENDVMQKLEANYGNLPFKCLKRGCGQSFATAPELLAHVNAKSTENGHGGKATRKMLLSNGWLHCGNRECNLTYPADQEHSCVAHQIAQSNQRGECTITLACSDVKIQIKWKSA